MFYSKNDLQNRKLVTFYSIFSCVYFSMLIFILVFTNGIYSAGKYKFGSVILFILIAETIKYLISFFYIKPHDLNLGKRQNEKFITYIIKNFCEKSKLKSGLETSIMMILLIAVYFITFILYGAEMFSKHEETLMLSCLMTVLTIFPTCLNLGRKSVSSLFFGAKPINKLESLCYYNFCFSIVGAWLGAFVIPLDWDRPWQVWPIPCSFGALLGFLFSHFVMLLDINDYFFRIHNKKPREIKSYLKYHNK